MAEQQYYVFNKGDETKGWMDACIVWWRAEGKGYTYDLNQAGLFTDSDKEKNYPPVDNCVYVPKELVEARAYTPKLAWWSRTKDALLDPAQR